MGAAAGLQGYKEKISPDSLTYQNRVYYMLPNKYMQLFSPVCFLSAGDFASWTLCYQIHLK